MTYSQSYYQRNKARIKKRSKKYYHANKKEILEKHDQRRRIAKLKKAEDERIFGWGSIIDSILAFFRGK